jgi:Tfp pilus assembly PilM family ATPase
MSAPSTQKKTFNLFPPPDFLLLATSGIYVSDESIKMVELRRGVKRGELELIHASEALLPHGAVEAGVVKDQEAVAVALKEVQGRARIEYTRAALPEEKAYLFTAYVDDVEGADLDDAVAFIIEENAPVTIADSVFSYDIIKKEGLHGEKKVAVAVVPKFIVEAQTELYRSAGITPVSFDLESQAIARAVVPHGDARSTLIINLADKKTGLYLVEEGVVQFSLTPGLGLDQEDASADLRSEIRKLFTFWNTRVDKRGRPEKKIERIIVAGPGGANREFVESLLEGVEIEHRVANVWVNIFTSEDRYPDMAFEKSLEYAAAVGLALASRIK